MISSSAASSLFLETTTIVEDIAQYQRVLDRLILTDDSQLEPVLWNLLPIVFEEFLKLGQNNSISIHARQQAHTALINIINHGLCRCRGLSTLRINLLGLIKLWDIKYKHVLLESKEGTIIRHLLPIFLTIGLNRLIFDNEELLKIAELIHHLSISFHYYRELGVAPTATIVLSQLLHPNLLKHQDSFHISIKGLSEAYQRFDKHIIELCSISDEIVSNPTDYCLANDIQLVTAFVDTLNELFLLKSFQLHETNETVVCIPGMDQEIIHCWMKQCRKQFEDKTIWNHLKLAIIQWLSASETQGVLYNSIELLHIPSHIGYVPLLIGSYDHYDAICTISKKTIQSWNGTLDFNTPWLIIQLLKIIDTQYLVNEAIESSVEIMIDPTVLSIIKSTTFYPFKRLTKSYVNPKMYTAVINLLKVSPLLLPMLESHHTKVYHDISHILTHWAIHIILDTCSNNYSKINSLDSLQLLYTIECHFSNQLTKRFSNRTFLLSDHPSSNSLGLNACTTQLNLEPVLPMLFLIINESIHSSLVTDTYLEDSIILLSLQILQLTVLRSSTHTDLLSSLTTLALTFFQLLDQDTQQNHTYKPSQLLRYLVYVRRIVKRIQSNCIPKHCFQERLYSNVFKEYVALCNKLVSVAFASSITKCEILQWYAQLFPPWHPSFRFISIMLSIDNDLSVATLASHMSSMHPELLPTREDMILMLLSQIQPMSASLNTDTVTHCVSLSSYYSTTEMRSHLLSELFDNQTNQLLNDTFPNSLLESSKQLIQYIEFCLKCSSDSNDTIISYQHQLIILLVLIEHVLKKHHALSDDLCVYYYCHVFKLLIQDIILCSITDPNVIIILRYFVSRYPFIQTMIWTGDTIKGQSISSSVTTASELVALVFSYLSKHRQDNIIINPLFLSCLDRIKSDITTYLSSDYPQHITCSITLAEKLLSQQSIVCNQEKEWLSTISKHIISHIQDLIMKRQELSIPQLLFFTQAIRSGEFKCTIQFHKTIEISEDNCQLFDSIESLIIRELPTSHDCLKKQLWNLYLTLLDHVICHTEQLHNESSNDFLLKKMEWFLLTNLNETFTIPNASVSGFFFSSFMHSTYHIQFSKLLLDIVISIGQGHQSENSVVLPNELSERYVCLSTDSCQISEYSILQKYATLFGKHVDSRETCCYWLFILLQSSPITLVYNYLNQIQDVFLTHIITSSPFISFISWRGLIDIMKYSLQLVPPFTNELVQETQRHKITTDLGLRGLTAIKLCLQTTLRQSFQDQRDISYQKIELILSHATVIKRRMHLVNEFVTLAETLQYPLMTYLLLDHLFYNIDIMFDKDIIDVLELSSISMLKQQERRNFFLPKSLSIELFIYLNHCDTEVKEAVTALTSNVFGYGSIKDLVDAQAFDQDEQLLSSYKSNKIQLLLNILMKRLQSSVLKSSYRLLIIRTLIILLDQTLPWVIICPMFRWLWTFTLTEMDALSYTAMDNTDKESNTAIVGLGTALRQYTVRSCTETTSISDIVSSIDSSKNIGEVLGSLCQIIQSMCERYSGNQQISLLCMNTLKQCVETSGIHIRPYLSTVIPFLITSLAALEPAEFNFYYFHTKRDLGIHPDEFMEARVTLSSGTPAGILLQRIAKLSTPSVIQEVTQELVSILKTGIGITAKVGVLKFLRSVIMETGIIHIPPNAAKKLLDAVCITVFDLSVVLQRHSTSFLAVLGRCVSPEDIDQIITKRFLNYLKNKTASTTTDWNDLERDRCAVAQATLNLLQTCPEAFPNNSELTAKFAGMSFVFSQGRAIAPDSAKLWERIWSELIGGSEIEVFNKYQDAITLEICQTIKSSFRQDRFIGSTAAVKYLTYTQRPLLKPTFLNECPESSFHSNSSFIYIDILLDAITYSLTHFPSTTSFEQLMLSALQTFPYISIDRRESTLSLILISARKLNATARAMTIRSIRNYVLNNGLEFQSFQELPCNASHTPCVFSKLIAFIHSEIRNSMSIDTETDNSSSRITLLEECWETWATILGMKYLQNHNCIQIMDEKENFLVCLLEKLKTHSENEGLLPGLFRSVATVIRQHEQIEEPSGKKESLKPLIEPYVNYKNDILHTENVWYETLKCTICILNGLIQKTFSPSSPTFICLGGLRFIQMFVQYGCTVMSQAVASNEKEPATLLPTLKLLKRCTCHGNQDSLISQIQFICRSMLLSETYQRFKILLETTDKAAVDFETHQWFIQSETNVNNKQT